MDDVKRAAVYLRVSTEEQAERYGLDVQRERCVGAAKAKGWSVVCEYADEGVSGTLDADARPGLAALMTAVEAGDIEAVIILSLDRLGRSARLVLALVDRLGRTGAEIVSCKESLDTSTPAGRFVLTIFAGLAELERDVITERTTAGRNARGRRDGERGGRLPMGYVRTEAGPDLEPEGAGVVRRIFSERVAGATLAAIADGLNAEGIRTPRGGSWHPSSVRVILDNRAAYAGACRGASAVAWPAILVDRREVAA